MERKCLVASGPGGVNRVWSILSEYGQYERHFNTIQSTYRALASTWMLSAFGGIGYVLSQPTTAIDRWALVFSIAIGAGIGMLLLCTLDLLVYHRLLLSVFDEAWLLEKAAGLPLLRKSMANPASIPVNKAVYCFYAIPSAVFAIVALIGVISSWGAVWTFFGLPLLFALVGGAVLLRSVLPAEENPDCEKAKCPLRGAS
jgi:hypothetical protein